MAEGNSAFSLYSPHCVWTGGSTYTLNEQPDQDERDRVNMQLYDMFVDTVDPCVIQEVAQSRNWNINEAINDLVTLTSSDCRKQESPEQCLPGSPNERAIQSAPGGSKGTHKIGKKKSNLEAICSRQGNSLTGLPDLIDLNPQPKFTEVKISYNQAPGEDDDADVIIVKGNEFLPLGTEERTFTQQPSSSTASTFTSPRPQCFVQLMPEFLSNSKHVETNTVKKSVVQKERQKKNCPVKTDVNSIFAQFTHIKSEPVPITRVVLLIRNNIKVMVLMRGCPGSGKTHLSKLVLQKAQIKPDLYSKFIFSADNFFYQNGVYVFNPEFLGDAHAWTQKGVMKAAAESRNPIIVDNTHTQLWEMKAYAAIGVKYGYDLEILEPNTPWAYREKELAKRNVHDVPKSKIRHMLDRYERNIHPKMLLSQLNLQYAPGNKPPQLAVKKPIKQVKSGKKKKSTKKMEKSAENEKLLKKGNVLLAPPQVTEASKSETKRLLEYSSILDFNAVPEIRTLIENFNKQRGELVVTSSSSNINNNENITCEGTPNYKSMYNSFDFFLKEEESSSADNQSSSESESLITVDNLQNTAITTKEISGFVGENCDSNLTNGSGDLILFADMNSVTKSEGKQENISDISDSGSAFQDSLHSSFLTKPSNADHDNPLLENCDITCDETKSTRLLCSKYSFNAEALSKYIHSSEETNYCSSSVVEYKICANDDTLILENDEILSCDETEGASSLCTRYSLTAETLAEPACIVQDSTRCNLLTENTNSSADLISLLNEHGQETEYCVENRNSILNIFTASTNDTKSVHACPSENVCWDFVLVNDGSLTNETSLIGTEKKDLSVSQNVVTSESKRKSCNFSSLLLPQSDAGEWLAVDEQSHKQGAIVEENSDLKQIQTTDRVAYVAHDLPSEVPKQQNESVELRENISMHPSASSESNVIEKGIPYFEDRIVQKTDCNSFDTENKKIVNMDENQIESQRRSEDNVNVNQNLYEIKSLSYSDKKINVDDRVSLIVVQKEDSKNFNTINDKTFGDLDKKQNEIQNTLKKMVNSSSDLLVFDLKLQCSEENKNAIRLEEIQDINQVNSEKNVRSDEFSKNADLTVKLDVASISGSADGNNYNCIHTENIKNSEDEESCCCLNVNNDSIMSGIGFMQYLSDKAVQNKETEVSVFSNDKCADDILENNKSDSSPTFSCSSDKGCHEIATEELLGPVLDGSPIKNFDLLAYLSEKSIKKEEGSTPVDKSTHESEQEQVESCHILEENNRERKNVAAVEENVHEDWEKQGGSWDESDSKETEKDVAAETDACTPKPARNNTKFRAYRNLCGSPINLIENISNSCDWDTIDNPSFNWNSVDTVNRIESNTEIKPQRQKDSKPKPLGLDQSTNTCYTDFNLLHHDDSDETIKEKILFSKNRNICEERKPCINVYNPDVLMLDKSTMTCDDLAFETKLKYDFQQLVEMFPDIELGSLMEFVDRCGGNMDWAADVLADTERNTHITLNNTFHENCDPFLGTPDIFKDSSYVQVGEPSAEVLQLDVPSQSVRLKKLPKQEKKCVSESQLELKKLIESTFVLDKSHYSEHVWKIKKKKNGDYAKRENRNYKEIDGHFQDDYSYTHLEEAENSGIHNTKGDTEDDSSEEEEEEDKIDNAEDTEDDYSEEASGEIEEEEEDEFEFDVEAEDEEESTVKLALDWNFIMQLQKTFGSPLPDMKDLKPEVELPLSLARQVHSYVVESLIRQIEQQQEILDQMIAEDNAFAWQLQQEEEDKISASAQQPVPQLQEIMDMEMAFAVYRSDQEEWKQQSQDSMAARLSKQLLLEKFPQVDCNVLMEMFHAHNCSLHDTVATLSMSLSVDEPGLVQREMELLANAKEEKVKIQKSKETTLFTYVPTEENNQHMMVLKKEAGEMRTQASRYYELRKECFTKAQNMYRSGNKAVASYYSHLAELYKEKMELCNSQAAACLLYAQTNSRTLDLHFLHVAEAEEVLKLFLDESIAQLREKQKSRAVLYLITGRGLHSADGISRIKGMVMHRLKKRKIRFGEVNPGMLRAVITKNTQLSYK